jgi:hypothetical protein
LIGNTCSPQPKSYEKSLHLEALIAVTGKFLRPESSSEYRRRLHPELFHRLIDGYAKVLPNLKLHAYGGPGGRAGGVFAELGPHFWNPYPYSAEGQHEWLKEHVQVGHGALGELYPDRRFGDRTAFMEGCSATPRCPLGLQLVLTTSRKTIL